MSRNDLDRELEEKVGIFIRENSLIEERDRVLAAVSAGLDSMALLELLYRLSGKLRFSLAVAHFDHLLRGDQGRAECELVSKRCASLGIPFTSGSAQVRELAQKERLNLQDAARQARYSFLWKSAETLCCHRLATGHHRNDQAETVLIRLLSGSGFTGLAGIRQSSCSGRLIRPLLIIPRAELERFAAANGIPYAEDPSNLSDKYLRNRLRHKVIPKIEKEYDPSFTENLVLLANEAAILTDLLEERAAFLREKVVLESAPDFTRIDCRALAETQALVRRYLIRRVAGSLTSEQAILSGRPLNAVERLALCGSSGRRLDLPGGLAAFRQFDILYIIKKKALPAEKKGEEIEIPGEGKYSLVLGGSEWEIELRTEKYDGLSSKKPVPEKVGSERRYEERFDSGSVKFPLYAGAWRHGEIMRPFGLGGTKKLKKIFAEKRTPVLARKEIPVIRSSDGACLWICGVARSAIAPLSRGTEKVLIIRAWRLQKQETLSGSIIDT